MSDINTLLKEGRKRLDAGEKSSTKALLEAYTKALGEIKKEIATLFEKFGDDITHGQAIAYNRLNNLEKRIQAQIKILNGSATGVINTSLIESYKVSYYSTGYAFEETFKTGLGFGLLDPNKVKAAIVNPLDSIGWVERLAKHNKDLTYKLRQELTQGLIKGEGYAKTAKRITDTFEVTKKQAVTTAWTENHRVQNRGFLDGMDKTKNAADKLGIGIKKLWIATLDGRTRSSHRALDGKTAGADEVFTFPSGVTTEGPGLSGDPGEDIHCRCALGVKIDGLENRKRRDNEIKVDIEYKTYNKWQKDKGIK